MTTRLFEPMELTPPSADHEPDERLKVAENILWSFVMLSQHGTDFECMQFVQKLILSKAHESGWESDVYAEVHHMFGVNPLEFWEQEQMKIQKLLGQNEFLAHWHRLSDHQMQLSQSHRAAEPGIERQQEAVAKQIRALLQCGDSTRVVGWEKTWAEMDMQERAAVVRLGWSSETWSPGITCPNLCFGVEPAGSHEWSAMGSKRCAPVRT